MAAKAALEILGNSKAPFAKHNAEIVAEHMAVLEAEAAGERLLRLKDADQYRQDITHAVEMRKKAEAERDNYQSLLLAHETSDIHEVLSVNETLVLERDGAMRVLSEIANEDYRGNRSSASEKAHRYLVSVRKA